MIIKLRREKFIKERSILLVSILVGIALLGNTVLCIGSDGHMILEKSGAVGCGNLPGKLLDHPVAFAAGPDFQNNHCGPCMDVSLSAISSQLTFFSFQDVQSPVKASNHINDDSSTLSILRAGEDTYFSPIVYSTIARLNTTILLI